MDAFRNHLPLGSLIVTNYGTGPYKVVDIDGPSTEPSYLDDIEYDDPPPSKPHYNLSCVKAHEPDGTKPNAFLNGYELKDSKILSVWIDNDEIHIVGYSNRQQALF
jgi:hypothetical protein